MKSLKKAWALSIGTVLLASAMPLAASALTVGVSDEVDNTIVSGHLCRQSSTSETHSGSEWSSASATKNGTDHETGTTSGYVVDPANTSSNMDGNFTISANSSSGSSGHYNIVSNSSSSLSGASEVDTGITHTVSAFANP